MAKLEKPKRMSSVSAETGLTHLAAGVDLVQVLRGHEEPIGRIAWSPDGRFLASPSRSGRVRIWDADTGECIKVLRAHKGMAYCVAFDPNGVAIATGGNDGVIKFWHSVTGKLERTITDYGGPVGTVAYAPKGRRLAAGGGGLGLLMICDSSTGEIILHTAIGDRSGHHSILALSFDPSGDELAVGYGDVSYGIELLNAASGAVRVRLQGHQGNIFSVAWDPFGRTVASASSDNTIKLWNAEDGKLLRTLEGHTKTVNSVAFSADGRLIASKGQDNSIRIWRVTDGGCVASFYEKAEPDRWSANLAFHPRLPLLATVGTDPKHRRLAGRIVHIWKLDYETLLSQEATPTVTYTSTKIVLVGESNVGKSYLAHRIATGRRPRKGAIKSTHGMKFWPMQPERLSLTASAPEGQRRDVVLWDMGGQEEYRLIHQLFLNDTSVALVLLDPTRGSTAFKEVEMWNKYLDKQLRDRPALKLLVGAKLDEPSNTIDRLALERLREECGFAGYYETSALLGRGIRELCEAIAEVIDWQGLGKTSRPELFQRIRDEIESRRKRGEVVLTYSELHRSVGFKHPKGKKTAVHAVIEQLATQGVIARSRYAGEPVVVLQVQEIERYAGSLIIAAKNNPRGVPALELKSINSDFALPGIPKKTRLSPDQERPVVECTVQLLLEHGICFEHEGLLIFPTLFAPAPPSTLDTALPHAISLYYDFAEAIDNIYASLVAWLVIARDFGRVRLWSDRAEFEVKDGGLCGLRKVGRAGGFAHVDVYFETTTAQSQRELFISFVEEHLRRHGIEIREHVAVTCVCGHKFEEETLRKRIARGDKDVGCPVCERRHDLAEGAAETRLRDQQIEQRTWVLKTEIEKRRKKITALAVRAIEKTSETKPSAEPIRLLHLSDLHFTADTPVSARLQWLLDDLKQDGGLGFKELDYLVVSGDFTNRGSIEGFEKAYEFISGLAQEFALSAERCIFVPGNHDVVDALDGYSRRRDAKGLQPGEWIEQGKIIMAQDPEKYPLRFKPFSDGLYHKFLQRPYPLEYAAQGIAVPFWETGIQFLCLNSGWQIDEFHRKRSGLLPSALARAINDAQKQVDEAKASGAFESGQPLLRIAVWHHAVAGPEQMRDTECLSNLQKNGVKILLHGDVHEMRRDLVGYEPKKHLHVIGSGSFGAPPEGRPESTPRLYNVLEIARTLDAIRVYTRAQTKSDGAWDGWHEWPDPHGGAGRLAYYDVALEPT